MKNEGVLDGDLWNVQSLEKEKEQLMSHLQPTSRAGSAGDDPPLSPRSPTSTALLEHDLQSITEQTETLMADKLAAEYR